MATSGWSKCKKKFSGGFGKTIFAGFDREIWEKRSNKDHRNFAVRVRFCKTKIERERLESKTGVRQSVLLGLPCYDAIRMILIDPMHKIFLGKENYIFFKP